MAVWNRYLNEVLNQHHNRATWPIGRPCVLGHTRRVLVAHLDDCRCNLDAASARTYGGEEREGGGELTR